MMNNLKLKELKFEEFLWILFATLSLLNLIGTKKDEEYILTNNIIDKIKSNEIFTFTLLTTLFIYIYFLIRNINSFEETDNSSKGLYIIKVLGSILLISGILCLIYFQEKQNNFIGSPSI